MLKIYFIAMNTFSSISNEFHASQQFNPIYDGGRAKRSSPISFSPVTSTNVGISPKNF